MPQRFLDAAVHSRGEREVGECARLLRRVSGTPGECNRLRQLLVSDAERVVNAALDAFGSLEILVNNAGIVRDAQLVKMTEEKFDLVIDINLKGVFNCTQAVAPVMINQGGGVILNATSIVGLDGNFGQTNYVATKAGVVGMTKVWARELGRYNIRVNAVAPGFTATEMVMQMPERILDGMKQHTPLGRLGKPRDIANAAYTSKQCRLSATEIGEQHGRAKDSQGPSVLPVSECPYA